MTRRRWAATGVAGAIAVAAIGAVAALSAGDHATSDAAPASTAAVVRGDLAAAVSQDGILAYRARPDGSPYPVVNRARGTYTELPAVGDAVDCRGVLYRVDDEPVLLLCGTVPAYRALRIGDAGPDVRQLNRNLRVRGAGDAFTAETKAALAALQRRRGVDADGSLALGEAVFLPGRVRIAKVIGQLGGAAHPGARALAVTSGTLHVQIRLDPSEQRQVRRGDRALITLPGAVTVTGEVSGFGRTAQVTGARDAGAADATIPTSIQLSEPRRARGLDRAPVDVQIRTRGVENVLSVPVTALVGRAGGGFAVEVVHDDRRHELVTVDVGLFDPAAGRVEVEGALQAGDRVAVPSP